MNPMNPRKSAAFEARRVTRASAEHEVAVAIDEELDAGGDFVRRTDRVGRRAADQIRSVRVEHEVEHFRRAVRSREAVREAVAVLERCGARRVEHARVDRRERRARHVVCAEAGVQSELELAGRAESFFADELRPEHPAAIGARLAIRVAHRDARLKRKREAESFFDARDAPLRVDREKLDVLRVERRSRRARRLRGSPAWNARVVRAVVAVLRRADDAAVRTTLVEILRRTIDEDDGHVETDLDVIEETEVESERSLERVRDEGVRATLRERAVGAEERATVVDDEADRKIEVTEDVASVRREESLRVERGTKQVRVEAVAAFGVWRADQRVIRACSARKSEGTECRRQPENRPNALHLRRNVTRTFRKKLTFGSDYLGTCGFAALPSKSHRARVARAIASSISLLK